MASAGSAGAQSEHGALPVDLFSPEMRCGVGSRDVSSSSSSMPSRSFSLSLTLLPFMCDSVDVIRMEGVSGQLAVLLKLAAVTA